MTGIGANIKAIAVVINNDRARGNIRREPPLVMVCLLIWFLTINHPISAILLRQ